MFERLTSEPHDHGTKGDLRMARVRRGRESQEFDPTAGPEKASVDDRAAIVSGWPDPDPDTLDSSLGRAELARTALRAARKAIQIAQEIASIDEREGLTFRTSWSGYLVDLLVVPSALLKASRDRASTSVTVSRRRRALLNHAWYRVA